MKITSDSFSSKLSTSNTTSQANRQDSSYFSSLLSSSGSASVSSALAGARETADLAYIKSIDATRSHILQAVVDQKNSMMLESRGSSARKTTEISKDISF